MNAVDWPIFQCGYAYRVQWLDGATLRYEILIYRYRTEWQLEFVGASVPVLDIVACDPVIHESSEPLSDEEREARIDRDRRRDEIDRDKTERRS